MRKSFVFYESFYDAINDVDEKTQLQLYKAICELSIKGIKPELTGLAATLFKLIAPQLEANTKKFEDGQKGKEHGKKGGRPRKETETQEVKEIKTPVGLFTQTPNVNENVNDNENNITPLSTKVDISPKGENTPKKSTKPKKDLENDPLFLKFWGAYPNKKNIPPAARAFGKIKPMSTELLDKILLGIERYQNSGLWNDKKFIPYPATFLNNRKWEDEIENLSAGVNRDGKASYDIEGYQSFCRNNLMRPKPTDAFSETLDEQEKLEFIEVEVT